MTRSPLLDRRRFGLGMTALLAGTCLPAPARAAGTRSVTTALGTYDIPVSPQRVVAIDARTDYEAAMVLGLNVIAVGTHSNWEGREFVPHDDALAEFAMPPTAEAILALEPDLIICPIDDPDGEWWPARRLSAIAPVVTTTFTRKWQDDLLELGAWLDRSAGAEAAIGRYQSAVAALRQRHAAYLEGNRIAIITYMAETGDFVAFTPGPPDDADPKEQLLADIGARTLDPALLAENGFSMENMLAILDDVDAIMLCDMGMGGPDDLRDKPLWQRVPAVAAGKVYVSKAMLWYGSYFTAMKAVDELAALLGQVDA